jgi:ribosomal protein L40E
MATFSWNAATPGVCKRCGARVKLSELRQQVVAGRVTSLRVCCRCFDKDNPQLLLGRIRASDPQRVRDPRPPMELELDTPSGSFLDFNLVLDVSLLGNSST